MADGNFTTYRHSLIQMAEGEQAQGHPTVMLGFGEAGALPSAELETCAICLARHLLEECFCCAEHAAEAITQTWGDDLSTGQPPPNRQERRRLARGQRR